MTSMTFRSKTGYWPNANDLDIVNCEKAGLREHMNCGVCSTCKAPMSYCKGH